VDREFGGEVYTTGRGIAWISLIKKVKAAGLQHEYALNEAVVEMAPRPRGKTGPKEEASFNKFVFTRGSPIVLIHFGSLVRVNATS
jgi:hypothetical protein